MEDYIKILEAANWLKIRLATVPKTGIILGSGLGIVGEEIEQAIKLPFSDIPHFPVTTVAGHQGQIITGNLNGKQVLVMQGRIHYYEGYSMKEVIFPLRMMQLLGIKNLMVTNASGGLHADFRPGDICLITDHLNLMGVDPLRGPNDDRLGPRFPDLSQAYDPHFLNLARQEGQKQGLNLKEGVYAAISGPCYETMAEVRYLKNLGAELVGMSIVPEVIAARHGGIRVLGISCITDTPLHPNKEGVSHQQVVDVAAKAAPKIASLIRGIIKKVED
ncbi:MAG: purine nucleoside phosphorylase [Saprospiraceae bacterium]|nr:MAG: purine nucleoside phosphorylase [Saprospiraceae bacterium]